jgi:drug/metabolite transporter (DMT)-like permease
VTRASLLKGTALMCLVVLIWGTFLPVSKLVLAVIDPYYLTALRYGVAALCFLAVLVHAEGIRAVVPSGRVRVVFLFGSAGFAGFSILTYEGLRLTRPETAAVILALTPVLVALHQWLATGRRPRAPTLVCIALAMAGEVLVVSHADPQRLFRDASALGNLLVLFAAVCWTAYTLGVQHLAGWSPLRYTALSASLGWISIALATGIATASGHSQPPPLAGMRELFWPIAYISIVVSFVAMLSWNTAVRHIGPLNASLFANFAPVITFLIVAWQGQPPHPAEVLGAVLVIVALVTNNLYNRRLVMGAEAVAARPTSSRVVNN